MSDPAAGTATASRPSNASLADIAEALKRLQRFVVVRPPAARRRRARLHARAGPEPARDGQGRDPVERGRDAG